MRNHRAIECSRTLLDMRYRWNSNNTILFSLNKTLSQFSYAHYFDSAVKHQWWEGLAIVVLEFNAPFRSSLFFVKSLEKTIGIALKEFHLVGVGLQNTMVFYQWVTPIGASPSRCHSLLSRRHQSILRAGMVCGEESTQLPTGWAFVRILGCWGTW